MSHHRWADVPSEQINESIARRFITGDSVTVGRFELKQGGVVPPHSHANEQISIVLSGVLLFKMEGQETIVSSITSTSCGTFGGICITSPPRRTVSRPSLLKRRAPSMTMLTCSFSWECIGTTPPRFSSKRATVTRSPLMNRREIDGLISSAAISLHR